MNIFELVAAFGGGMFGAAVGPLPAFIITGVFSIICGIVSMAGGVSISTVNVITFGSFLGPHIAFAGGVAASAFAQKKGLGHNGTDNATPLNKYGDASVLIVGGVFGVIGFLFANLFVAKVFGPILPATDTPGMVVVISAIIVRLVFGTTGLVGKYDGKGKREWISGGAGFIYNIVIGAGFGLLVSALGLTLAEAGVNTGLYPVTCFGIAAFGLIFAQTGFAFPTCHHIVLPAASAALMSGNLFVGVLVGAICSVFGDFAGKTFNSYADTHIDPPAITIFISIFLINAIWG